MIVFPSVSKARYAQEKLKTGGHYATIGKSPAGLMQSCSYAVFLGVQNIGEVLSYLKQQGVDYSGAFQQVGGQYRKI